VRSAQLMSEAKQYWWRVTRAGDPRPEWHQVRECESRLRSSTRVAEGRTFPQLELTIAARGSGKAQAPKRANSRTSSELSTYSRSIMQPTYASLAALGSRGGPAQLAEIFDRPSG